MKYHMCVSIAGALNRFNPKDWVDVCRDPNMKRFLYPLEVKYRLLDMREKGMKVFPLDGCDNFDDQKGCLGHPDD